MVTGLAVKQRISVFCMRYWWVTATLDRSLHHSEVINIKGKSYRLGQRAARKQDADNPPTK